MPKVFPVYVIISSGFQEVKLMRHGCEFIKGINMDWVGNLTLKVRNLPSVFGSRRRILPFGGGECEAL